MRPSGRTIPPLTARLAEGRPVLGREQISDLAKRVMGMTSATSALIDVTHTARVVTRVANNQVLSGDDGDELTISVWSRFGEKMTVTAKGNQLDDAVLHAMVRQCEAIARENVGSAEEIFPRQEQVPDTFVATHLWHDDTIRAMTATRDTVIPELLGVFPRDQWNVSGFVGLMARSEAFLSKEGIAASSEETDCEVTVTVRGKDGKSSGWDGQAARDWSTIRYTDVATRAMDLAKLSRDPVALEPGRRTVILSATAVAQMLRYLAAQFDAMDTDLGLTAFSRRPTGNKLGQRLFDPRVMMRSDPADPDGGYRPYFARGHATPPMVWVENGVLKNLAYNPTYAMQRGKAYAEWPFSLRMDGGASSVDQLIAQCREGVYVNRLSEVELIDIKTGMLTGVTRDGCLLIKNGKIDRPLRNFRFVDSPFFFLNTIEAMGPTARAAFGYTPSALLERGITDWPRRPMIVPPMMVRDFNFTALADAV